VEFRFAETAASALGALWRRAQYLQQPVVAESRIGFPAGLREWVRSLPDGWLDASAVTELFNRAGLPILQTVRAGSADTAAKAAEGLGYPVVMKIDSPDILHKSDVGGVLLDLRNGEAVRHGYETVMQRARAARPEARLEGVLLQQMAGQGQEVIAGMVRDPQFGAMMMFGLGGTEVEGLKDVAFELAPLTATEADGMLAHTWAGRKLDGFRNIPAADRQAVLAVLMQLSQLAEQVPELTEVEINPLRVLAPGSGALAIDVRVRKGG
jgi:acetyltransferase